MKKIKRLDIDDIRSQEVHASEEEAHQVAATPHQPVAAGVAMLQSPGQRHM